MSKSPIRDFYSGRAVLITGSTGYVGKVLLEKLVRAFDDISAIYVLLRPKKGLTIEQRLKVLLGSRCFSFHPHSEQQLRKVIPIAGDVSEANLGISEEDRRMLAQQVSIVFHNAATIRFDALLADHVKNNVKGALHVSEFCKQLKKFACLIHVSTAFSHCNHKVIDEKLYPILVTPTQLLQLHSTLSPEALEKVAPDFLDGRPNSYVFSKAIAEHLVHDTTKGMTVAIIRPSIVSPAQREPAQGWVDSVHGPAGLSILAGIGILQAIDWEYNTHADVTHVDFLANLQIAAAWHMNKHSPNQLKFFNMSSTNMVPMSSGDFMTVARTFSDKYPSIFSVRPTVHPPKQRPHPWRHAVEKFLYHVLFAYFIDFFLMLAGRERIMVRIVNKMHHAIDLMKYFVTNEWKFGSENFFQLIRDLSPHDEDEFDVDMRKFRATNGEKLGAICNSWLGCRRYILKEPDSNLTLARAKYTAVCFFYQLWLLMKWYLLYKLLFVWTPIASSLYSYLMLDLIVPNLIVNYVAPLVSPIVEALYLS